MLRNAFSGEFDPHPPHRNANNVEPYTFVTLFSGKAVIPHPPWHYVTLEWPLSADMKDDLDIMRQCRQLYAQGNECSCSSFSYVLGQCESNLCFALIVLHCTLRNCGGSTRLAPLRNCM